MKIDSERQSLQTERLQLETKLRQVTEESESVRGDDKSACIIYAASITMKNITQYGGTSSLRTLHVLGPQLCNSKT